MTGHRTSIDEPGHAHELTFSWYGRFRDNVIMPKSLLKMIDYVHANPVRQQLVQRARDWKWSSAA